MFWATIISLLGVNAMIAGAPPGITFGLTVVVTFIVLVRRDYKRIMKKYYGEE